MNTTRLITLILATALIARADVLPPAQDSSSLKGKLTPITGKATTLAVSAYRKGYVLFNLDNLPQDVASGDIANARLRVYFPAVSTAGDITIHLVTGAWTENRTVTEPTVDANASATIPAASVVAKKFVEVDLTNIVRNWLFGMPQNFGFAFEATGKTNVLIGSKEGPGNGYPCELDIEIQRPFTIASGSVTGSQLASGLTLGGTTTFSGTALLPSGTATVAPLRFQSGTNLTLPVFGAVEFDGTNLYLTNNSGSPTRKTLAFTDTTIGTEQITDGSVTTAKLAGSILPQLLSSSSAPFPANANNAGTVYFNSANKRLYFSDGTSWLPVGNSQAVYRWALWSTYNEASGWFFNNGDNGDNNLTGGIIPSVWSDGNGMANQISSDKNVQAALFNKKAAISPSSVVWSETWLAYSSTNSKFAGALFRVRNKTGDPINWTLQYYATAYGGWGERASIALNGVSVWNTTGDSTASSIYSLVMSIPANRISTVICVAGASPGANSYSGWVRSTLLAFRNNCLTLPDGLEFVDDLDTAIGGYEQ